MWRKIRCRFAGKLVLPYPLGYYEKREASAVPGSAVRRRLELLGNSEYLVRFELADLDPISSPTTTRPD